MSLLRIKDEYGEDDNATSYHRTSTRAATLFDFVDLDDEGESSGFRYDIAELYPEDATSTVVGCDEAINSDEERSRMKRKAEFMKATAPKAKKARRNPNPPEDWKEKVIAGAPENVQLSEADFVRRDAPVRFIDRAAENNVEIAEDGTVSVPSVLPMPVLVGKKKERSHLMYLPHTPISIQRTHLRKPVELDKATTNRIAEIEANVASGSGTSTPMVYDGMPGTQIVMSSTEMVRDVDDAAIAKGIVFPKSVNIFSLGMDSVMANRLPANFSGLLAQNVLHNPRCQTIEFGYISRKLRETHIYNWPHEGLGLADEYYANMTFISRADAERMSREPYSHERPCIEGRNCAGCQIPRCTPITLVEYLTAADIAEFTRTRKWPRPQGHCYLCKIMNASNCAPRIMAECAAYSSEMVKSRMTAESLTSDNKQVLKLVDFFCNVGEGEFSPYDVFLSGTLYFTGIATPVPVFVRDRFKQRQRADGTRYYEHDYSKHQRNLDVWEAEVSKALSQTRQLRQVYEISAQTVVSFEPRQCQ